MHEEGASQEAAPERSGCNLGVSVALDQVKGSEWSPIGLTCTSNTQCSRLGGTWYCVNHSGSKSISPTSSLTVSKPTMKEKENTLKY